MGRHHALMHRFPHVPRKKSRIEIIPMIDVMMFLLVFFVLISINVIPAMGLQVRLPQSSAVEDQRSPQRVVVGIRADGAYTLDGDAVADMAALSAKLQARKATAAQGIAVVVQGDASAPIQKLVDVMDVLKAQGLNAMTVSAQRR